MGSSAPASSLALLLGQIEIAQILRRSPLLSGFASLPWFSTHAFSGLWPCRRTILSDVRPHRGRTSVEGAWACIRTHYGSKMPSLMASSVCLFGTDRDSCLTSSSRVQATLRRTVGRFWTRHSGFLISECVIDLFSKSGVRIAPAKDGVCSIEGKGGQFYVLASPIDSQYMFVCSFACSCFRSHAKRCTRRALGLARGSAAGQSSLSASASRSSC